MTKFYSHTNIYQNYLIRWDNQRNKFDIKGQKQKKETGPIQA